MPINLRQALHLWHMPTLFAVSWVTRALRFQYRGDFHGAQWLCLSLVIAVGAMCESVPMCLHAKDNGSLS